MLEITSRNFRKCKNLECNLALVNTYTYKDIRFETPSTVESMVIDESPSSLSSLAVMQLDDDLSVHLNVYISLFKQC